jgi:hypothetical protein
MSWLDSVSIVGRNINYCNKNGLFTRHTPLRGQRRHCYRGMDSR